MLFIILNWTKLLYFKCISINVQISIGRTTKDNQVDVDLSLEGPSFKISRRQGAIKLRNSGEFILINNGKRPMYVDSKPVMPNAKLKLHNNSVIEVCLAFQDVFVTSCSVQHIGHVTAFWQCNFEPKFLEIRSQRVIPMKSPFCSYAIIDWVCLRILRWCILGSSLKCPITLLKFSVLVQLSKQIWWSHTCRYGIVWYIFRTFGRDNRNKMLVVSVLWPTSIIHTV